MKSEKINLILLILCFSIIVSLCFAVYINGRNLSCDKCSITFTQNEGFEFKVGVQELYTNLIKGKCLVGWDKTMGFIDFTKEIYQYGNLS